MTQLQYIQETYGDQIKQEVGIAKYNQRKHNLNWIMRQVKLKCFGNITHTPGFNATSFTITPEFDGKEWVIKEEQKIDVLEKYLRRVRKAWGTYQRDFYEDVFMTVLQDMILKGEPFTKRQLFNKVSYKAKQEKYLSEGKTVKGVKPTRKPKADSRIRFETLSLDVPMISGGDTFADMIEDKDINGNGLIELGNDGITSTK